MLKKGKLEISSFWALLCVGLAIFCCGIYPWDIKIAIVFAVSTGFGVIFSYRAIKQKRLSDKVVGWICLFITAVFVVLPVIGYFFDST